MEQQALQQSPEPNNLHSSPDLNGSNEAEATNQASNTEVEFASLSVEEMEKRFEVGQPIENDLIAYGLYCIYARTKGFSVRKDSCVRFSDGSGVKARDFVCSCEGNKDEKRSRLNIPASVRPTVRCQCKAKIRIARLKGQNWRVTAFRKEHNHDMYPPDQAHLLRISQPSKSELDTCFEAMVKCGISVARAHEFLQSLSNENEDVGPSRQVYHDPLSRTSKIEDNDATQLVQHFIGLSNKEPYFYWSIEKDHNNKLMNFFLRDYRCSADYECFGDVLTVANTFRTNKYNLICVPFLGLNNHFQNVMFGCAFMSDESELSFSWLFRSFLESMGGKQPGMLFTDQSQAVMNTVGTVFPNSLHRLSHRHISQSAQSHFGSLSSDSNFRKLWQKCMTDCQNEEEFELTWRQMVDGNTIIDKDWFTNMYGLRHKWAANFSNHRFSAGLDTTLKTKDINVSLKRKLGSSTSSLYDCVLAYERVQQSWRMDEKHKDTISHHGKLPVGRNPWLMQAAEVYTMEVFALVQQEVHQSIDYSIAEQHAVSGTPLMWFAIKSRGGSSYTYKVEFDRQTLSINCSCRKFEVFGILCCHVFKVFDRINLEYIPKKYIQRRWTKTARNRISDGQSSVSNGGNVPDMEFVNLFMREMYDLATKAQNHEETRCILTEALENCKLKVNAWFENAGPDIFGTDNNLSIDEDDLLEDEIHDGDEAHNHFTCHRWQYLKQVHDGYPRDNQVYISRGLIDSSFH